MQTYFTAKFNDNYTQQYKFAQQKFLFLVCSVVVHGVTVNSRYSGPLNCGHLNIAAAYLGTDLKLHQDCTILASDLRSPRYSVLHAATSRDLILQPEVMFVGVVMVKT